MRVTTSTLANNYLKHLGRTSEDLSISRKKAATLRKYLSVEEDPGAYVREARITRDYKKNEDYQKTADQAAGLLENQDKIMQSILDMSRDVSKKYSIRALNDTNAAQRQIFASQLESLQEAMVRTLNSNDSGDFVFSGADGAVPPFELKNGRLYYRGLDVQTGRTKDGNKLPDTTKEEKTLDMLNDEKLYFDLGYGLNTKPQTNGIPQGSTTGYYAIKDSSAFNAATSGLKAIGWADKYDNTTLFDSINGSKYTVAVDKGENLITLAGKMAKMLRQYDRSKGGYSEYATDESGILLHDAGHGSRLPMTDAANGNTVIYEKDIAVNEDGVLINKFTGNKLVKTAASGGGQPEYWTEKDIAVNVSDWNESYSKVLKKFDAAYNRALETETGIGVKMNFVDVTKNRLKMSQDILTDRFHEVAMLDPEKAFTEYSFALTHYNTALKLGSSIIPKTLAEMLPF